MERIAIIVKYFPPSRRISGLTSFAALLAGEMAPQCELHVFSACTGQQAKEFAAGVNYRLHAVGEPYWLKVGMHVRKIRPSRVLVLSGVCKSGLIWPAFGILRHWMGSTPVYYCQATNLDKPPSGLNLRMLRSFAEVICTSPQLMGMLQGPLKDRCHCIVPGVDVSAIDRAPVAPEGAAVRVGYFNHFKHLKGVDVALGAFDSLPFEDTEYVAAGSGPMEQEMRTRFGHNKRIKIVGYLPDPIPDLKACDFMVLPFRKSQSILGVSQTVLECLAAGVPVIGSQNEAIAPAIRHEQEGLLFTTGQELVDCIRRLHDDAALRERLSRNARLRAQEFSIQASAGRFLDLMRKEK